MGDAHDVVWPLKGILTDFILWELVVSRGMVMPPAQLHDFDAPAQQLSVNANLFVSIPTSDTDGWTSTPPHHSARH